MQSESFAIPPRRVRRISLTLAAMLHAVAIALILNYLLGQFQQIGSVEPIVSGELVDEEIVERLTAHIDELSPPPQTAQANAQTAIEPGESVVESIASRLRDYQNAEAGPDPLETVRRNAAMLERISNAKEVDRMASRLRDAMDASSMKIREPDANTPAVDWDHAVQADARRIEEGDLVEIHETFVDNKGGASAMVHTRQPGGDSGTFAYHVYLIEKGEKQKPNGCTADEFEAAAARVQPFEVIREYPLLRELHRSAIIPIMQKLSDDEAASQPTTQPVATDD